MEASEGIKNVKCEVVTPEGLVLDEHAQMVVIPGEVGEIGVLPRHAPIVTNTIVGEVRVKTMDGKMKHLAVGNGYAKMQYDRLMLLVDTAEKAEDIDIDRAEEAIKRAEKWLDQCHEAGVDCYRAQQSRNRAKNRLRVAGKA
ncbi:MAG: ATP synthase F1 subunit epsilon [Gaiellales bacterium]|nr:MAG: ATP synthase F1 subunit epsilon [Gaiellales bacterium]